MNTASRARGAVWAARARNESGLDRDGPSCVCRILKTRGDVISPRRTRFTGSHGGKQRGEEKQSNTPNSASPTRDDEGGKALVSSSCRKEFAAMAQYLEPVGRPGEAEIQGVPHLESRRDGRSRFRPNPKRRTRQVWCPFLSRNDKLVEMQQSYIAERRT